MRLSVFALSLSMLAGITGAATMAADAQSRLPVGVSSCGLNMEARFVESAPRDRFELRNNSQSQWSITSATFDLAPSLGRLVFDTEEGGTGVEVFQPFRAESGNAKLRWLSKLSDGSSIMTLDFNRFESGDDFTFTIDVDDTLTASDLGQIRVADREIEGANVELVMRGPGGVITSATMTFGSNGTATVKGKTCN